MLLFLRNLDWKKGVVYGLELSRAMTMSVTHLLMRSLYYTSITHRTITFSKKSNAAVSVSEAETLAESIALLLAELIFLVQCLDSNNAWHIIHHN